MRMSKDKKIIIAVVLVLLAVTAVMVILHLGSRTKVPEHSLMVVADNKENLTDLNGLDTEPIKGTVVNGKGETKEIEGEGISLASLIDTDDYSEVSVISDDEYSANIKKTEMDRAWLQIEDGKARLYVFEDKDSKRNVKNVVRIEVR